MENASKALLIAGGVLIAIIIITLLIRTYGSIGSFQRQQISQEEAERIEAFNKEYIKYQNQYVYGTEVITAINRAVNNEEYNCKVYIEFRTEPYTYKTVNWVNGKKELREAFVGISETLTVDPSDLHYTGLANGNEYIFLDYDNNKEAIEDLKGRYFQCTSSSNGSAIEYDNKTGRVTGIRFVEKERT